MVNYLANVELANAAICWEEIGVNSLGTVWVIVYHFLMDSGGF